MELTPGTSVRIMENGQWVGPFTVTTLPGRTPDHVVLVGHRSMFEHCADEFNTQPIPVGVKAWATA
jgi:hypothetical protein